MAIVPSVNLLFLLFACPFPLCFPVTSNAGNCALVLAAFRRPHLLYLLHPKSVVWKLDMCRHALGAAPLQMLFNSVVYFSSLFFSSETPRTSVCYHHHHR